MIVSDVFSRSFAVYVKDLKSTKGHRLEFKYHKTGDLLFFRGGILFPHRNISAVGYYGLF